MNLGNSIIISSTQKTNIYYDLKEQVSDDLSFGSMFMDRIIIPFAIALEISLRVEI